jgi:uncharacterized membrane protein
MSATPIADQPVSTAGNVRHSSMLDQSFRASIILKGLHAFMETVGGIALLVIAPETINRIAIAAVNPELSNNPQGFIATHVLRASQNFANGGKHFAAWYLLSHGIVKLVLVIELLRNRLWAYPLLVIMLSAFVGYQTYRFVLTHSIAMVLLTVFDLVVIVLTCLEYRKQRSIFAEGK